MDNLIESIALDRLIAHPDNPNRMSSGNFAKLVRNIEQTGRYEPLIVRYYREKPRHSRRGRAEPRHCERSEAISSDSRGRDCHGPQSGPRNDSKHRASSIENRGRFQIINGYHRWQALRQLGYKRADVIVWDVDDDQADLLLATLNRIAGSDELSKKISLLKKLSNKMNARELSKLIPQTPGQIKRLVNLRIPRAPAKIPSDKFPNPLVFFVTDEQKKAIEEALLFARGHSHSFAEHRESSVEHRESSAGHRESSLNSAQAKAEALRVIAQHFIDTNLQRYDENKDQIRPA